MYSVALYKTLSRAELELRLNNLKHIARIWTQHKNVIDRVLVDPEYGRAQVKEWEEKIAEVVADAENIMQAIAENS